MDSVGWAFGPRVRCGGDGAGRRPAASGAGRGIEVFSAGRIGRDGSGGARGSQLRGFVKAREPWKWCTRSRRGDHWQAAKPETGPMDSVEWAFGPPGITGSSGLGWSHWSHHGLYVSPKFIWSRVRNGFRLGWWLHSLTREPSIWAGSGTFSLERSTLSMPLGWASKVCFSGYILRPLYTLHGKFFVKQQWSLTLLFFQFCDPPIYRQSQHLLRAPISSKRLVGTRSTQGLPRYTATVRKPTIGNCASWCHHTRGKRPSNERYLCHLVPLSASWHRYLSLTDR